MGMYRPPRASDYVRRAQSLYTRGKEVSRGTVLVAESIVRGCLALLTLMVIGTVIIVALAKMQTPQQTQDLLDKRLPVLTGFGGTAFGYYFGSRKQG